MDVINKLNLIKNEDNKKIIEEAIQEILKLRTKENEEICMHQFIRKFNKII